MECFNERHGYAVNGCAKEALEVFLGMQYERVMPNDVTLIGVVCL